MSEDASLMREIARLSESINNHRLAQITGGAPRARGSPARGARGGRARASQGYQGYQSQGYQGYQGHGYRGSSYHGYQGYGYSRGTRGSRGRGRARGYSRGFSSSRGRGSAAVAAPSSSLVATPCSDFTSTGKCARGLGCKFQHNPQRVALCRHALQSDCTNPTCTLSHTPNEHNAPMCVHYAKGSCTRDDCPYTHMAHIQSQTICPSFSLEGWCNAGAKCARLHLLECPEFAASGKCTRSKCGLKHVHRANAGAATAAAASSAPSVAARAPESINVDALLDGLDSDEEGDEEEAADEDADGSENEPVEFESGAGDPDTNFEENSSFIKI